MVGDDCLTGAPIACNALFDLRHAASYIGARETAVPVVHRLLKAPTLSRGEMPPTLIPKAAPSQSSDQALSSGAMSELGQTRKSVTTMRMSAYGGKADLKFGRLEVCL